MYQGFLGLFDGLSSDGEDGEEVVNAAIRAVRAFVIKNCEPPEVERAKLQAAGISYTTAASELERLSALLLAKGD